MIPASGAGGPGFDPRNSPFGALDFIVVIFGHSWVVPISFEFHFCVALLAQWLERAAVNRKVTGSIPVGSEFCCVNFLLVSLQKLRDRELNPGHPRDRRIY